MTVLRAVKFKLPDPLSFRLPLARWLWQAHQASSSDG